MHSSLWLFIVNPTAGGGRPQRKLAGLKRRLSRVDINYELVVSENKTHAQWLVSDAIKGGVRRFVVVGGDGSINDVIQPILLSGLATEITLTSLPWGTGNDWARNFNIPQAPKRFLNGLLRCKTQRHDVGVAHYLSQGQPQQRFFVNFASCGFDSYLLAQMGVAGGNSLSYYYYLIKLLFRYRATPIDIMFNRVESHCIAQKKLMTMACINEFGGGGMRFAPAASGQSGYLELVDINDLERLKRPFFLPKLVNGKINQAACVLNRKVKSLSVAPIENEVAPIWFQCDGELVAPIPMQAECIPRAINVVLF